MPYKRTYTMQEVHELLYESETRLSPKTSQPAHALLLHADLRGNAGDRRPERTFYLAATIEQTRKMNPARGVTTTYDPKPKDGRFTSRKDIIRAVHQGLNSAKGQGELQRFDLNASLKRITFKAPLGTPIRHIERFLQSTGRVDKNLVAHSVFLVIDRLGTPSECRIHIQTAYPDDIAAS